MSFNNPQVIAHVFLQSFYNIMYTIIFNGVIIAVSNLGVGKKNKYLTGKISVLWTTISIDCSCNNL